MFFICILSILFSKLRCVSSSNTVEIRHTTWNWLQIVILVRFMKLADKLKSALVMSHIHNVICFLIAPVPSLRPSTFSTTERVERIKIGQTETGTKAKRKTLYLKPVLYIQIVFVHVPFLTNTALPRCSSFWGFLHMRSGVNLLEFYVIITCLYMNYHRLILFYLHWPHRCSHSEFGIWNSCVLFFAVSLSENTQYVSYILYATIPALVLLLFAAAGFFCYKRHAKR